MRRKFAGNVLFLVFANVLVKPFWIFGIDRVVQNRVGPEAYGTYFALFNYSFLFSVFLDFGINNFNNRAIARHPARLNTYFGNLMVLKALLALGYFLLTLFAAMVTGFSVLHLKMLAVLAVNQCLLTYILYLRSNLTALHRFKADAVVSISDRLLAILICSWLLFSANRYTGEGLLYGFVFAQTAALALTVVLALLLLGYQRAFTIAWWRLRFFKAILYKAAPYALLGLLMGIYYRIDGVMLERLHSAMETGLYAQSFRLLDAVNQFGYLASIPLLPMFASMIKKRENLWPLLRLSGWGMLAFSSVAALICWFFGDVMMGWLYPACTDYSVLIFRILMVSFIPISSVYIFGTLLTANGNLSLLNGIAVLGIIVNVGLNLVLIPMKGALGAAMATLVTQVLVGALHLYVCLRIFKRA